MEKCEIGSATPQNMRMVPIPPAKSIVNHEMKLYCGGSSRRPSRTWPYGPKATKSRKTSQAVTPKMKYQPRLVTIHSRPVPKTSLVWVGKRSSRARMSTIRPAETKKIVGWVRSPRRRARASMAWRAFRVRR